MSHEQSTLDDIRANAELVVRVAREQLGVEVGYDEAGVRWLDSFIERQHQGGNSSNRDGLISTLGSYLGECIIRNYGGEWAEVDRAWCVRFDDRNAAFPFAKVTKQLDHGAADSVLSFFTAIAAVFRGRNRIT